MVELRKKVDLYAALSNEISKNKSELDIMKAEFEKMAKVDLENSKDKTIEYRGTVDKIIVQQAETVKPIAMTVLKDFLGRTVDDFIKTEQKETLNDSCKQFLTAMAQGEYIQSDIEKEVKKITDDPAKQKLLFKKLKGKYKSDRKQIMNIVGMSEEESGEYAFMIQEVFAYLTIRQIMKASQFSGTLEEAVEQVKASLIVDETIKVTLES